MQKVLQITVNILPILLMIGLIPVISNDYFLSLVYFLIITASFIIKRSKNDSLFLVFGIFTMAVFEYIFISTGVEVFHRNSLFGLMPLWLPILWGYGFVAIKRSIEILNQ